MERRGRHREQLQIEDQELGRRTLDALGRTTIRELSLRGANLDLAIHVLVRSPLATQLEVLVLDGEVSDDAALVLVRTDALARVRRLSIATVSNSVRIQLAERFGATA